MLSQEIPSHFRTDTLIVFLKRSYLNSYLSSRIYERRLVMQLQRPSSRVGAILSLLGSALVLCGVFFLPMLIVSGGIGNPNNRHYPTFEASVVYEFLRSSALGLQVIAVLFTLPLLSVLFVLGTSVARFSRELSPGMVKWRHTAAIGGLIVQGLLMFLSYMLYSISLSPDFGGGAGFVLPGFIVMIVGVFLN
jgi:hypothetical protein